MTMRSAKPSLRAIRLQARLILGAVAAITLTGCATLTSEHTDQLLVAHKDGYPIDLQRAAVLPDTFDSTVWNRVRASIDDYILRQEAVGRVPRLVVYVHGGLRTYQESLDYVARVLEAQKDSLFTQLASYHFLFVLWDSSLATSVLDDLVWLRFGESRATGPPSALFVTASRLAATGFLAPQSWYVQFGNAVDAVGVRDTKRWPWTECSLSQPDVDSNGSPLVNAAAFAMFYPLRALTVPVIHGFGTPAWDTMKRRAELLLATEKAISLKEPLRHWRGAVRVLMDDLRAQMPHGRWHGADGRDHELRITLMGHSMGTLVLDRILDEYHDVRFEKIVYMAAAASIDDVRSDVIPYLVHHPATTFWSFSLSETREALEWDSLDMFDRGSLLVWIDHYFQRINAPGDRVFGRAKNLREYFTPPDQVPARFFLVKLKNGREDPRRHGEFSEPRMLDAVFRITDGASKTCTVTR